MRKIISLLVSSMVLLLGFSQQAVSQTESPATIPSSLEGTYELTYDAINSGGPFSGGETVTLVINSNGTLCVNDLSLSDPVLFNGNPAEAIWTDSSSGFRYSVSNLTSGFNEVNVNNTSGTFFGQLSGSLTSNSTACDASSEVTVTADMNTVFSLAELKVPEYFPSGSITLFQDQYVYRFYPATGIYLAMADGNVFVLGGAFGDAIVDAGSISSIIATLEARETPTDSGSSDTGGSSTLWDLNISGTVTTTTFGIGNTINFQGLAVEDIPAPDLSNTDEINQEIISSLDGIASGISNISITVVNNSDSRRTFEVSFNASAIAAGVSVSYQLTYDYTR